MGDTPDSVCSTDTGNDLEEVYTGVGLAYVMNDWTFATNWGRIAEGAPRNAGQEGYGVAVNYDLGGGAEMQLGYGQSTCRKFIRTPTTILGGPVYFDAAEKCRAVQEETRYDGFSLGMVMSF